MHLQFDKDGLRFFFFTAAVQGRRPVLSRIVPVTGRRAAACSGWGVELSPVGEAVAALWRSVHARDPFLTASNFVIMPEESRFLAAGRQLVLSSFPPEVPEFPVNWDNCHVMNDRNVAMCTRARAV